MRTLSPSFQGSRPYVSEPKSSEGAFWAFLGGGGGLFGTLQGGCAHVWSRQTIPVPRGETPVVKAKEKLDRKWFYCSKTITRTCDPATLSMLHFSDCLGEKSYLQRSRHLLKLGATVESKCYRLFFVLSNITIRIRNAAVTFRLP